MNWHLGSAKEGIFKTLKTFTVIPIKENIPPIVAIATQIAIDNVSCSHYALRVVSQLFMYLRCRPKERNISIGS